MGRLGWVIFYLGPIVLGNGPYVLGNGLHVLGNGSHVFHNSFWGYAYYGEVSQGHWFILALMC